MDSSVGSNDKELKSLHHPHTLQQKLTQKNLEPENENSHSYFLQFPPDNLPEGQSIPT